MHLGMQQVQKLSQRLIMTPQMQQSIKLLQMNTMELEGVVEQELLENPFLEVEEETAETTGEAAVDESDQKETDVIVEAQDPALPASEATPDDGYETTPAQPAEEGPTPEGPTTVEALGDVETAAIEDQPEQFKEMDADWAELFEESYRSATYKPPVDDTEERSFEETVAGGVSLYEHLDWQLRVSSLTGRDAEIGRFLIGCIDENGYLQTNSTLDDCSEKFHLDMERIEEILETVEAFGQDGAPPDEYRKACAERFAGEELEAAEYLVDFFVRNALQRLPTTEECAQRFGVGPNDVERILIVIQEFDPTGVGARDLAECLCLQLAAVEKLDITAKETLTDHWEALTKKKFREIARALDETESAIRRVFENVQALDPNPGQVHTKMQPAYISPDVYVKKIDGKYIIYLNEGQVAHLRLSKTYRDILARGNDKNLDPKDREYAMDKFRAAVNFIRNIEKRRSTVLRVTEEIMDYQAEFLEKGVEAMRPLALSEIAERVSMHESTISRVTSGKYVNTPQGLFELKYFFSSSIRSDRGEDASSRAIRMKIKDLIEDEDARKPLSDDKIAKALKSQGFTIARRTVAKYREQMKILSTNLRRQRD